MHIKVCHTCTVILFFLLLQYPVFAQDNTDKKDTFFLANKRGLLGRFGKMISTSAPAPDVQPVRIENQFVKFKGKIIHSINLISLDFGCNIYDTCDIHSNLGIEIAKRFHKNSKGKTIGRDLFFRAGDKLAPYLLADNERYLRELVYIKDARIMVEYAVGDTNEVDVVVMTKDIFSLGGKLAINSKDKGRVDLKDENFGGSGSQVMVSSFYDKQRQPHEGFGAEIIKRNIRGSFIDWTTGFQNYNPAFNSGRQEETSYYTIIEKPLVTPYIPSTGALQVAYYKTDNAYITDSLYQSDYQYAYYNIDGWFGYSLDSKRSLYANKEIRVHRFIAARGFSQRFITLPVKYKTTFDYRYTDFTGALASLNIFKQAFYKTSFIYGFGISEDIPEGFSVAMTAGYINKENVNRPYAGIDFQFTNFRNRGMYNNYIFRVGGYFDKHRFEDADLLFQMEHFTRLRRLSPTWLLRSFITTSITAQVNPVLNSPLFLNSVYGLPYFDNGSINADMRGTFRGESVFFNTKKILGFKLAPFVFGDVSLLKATKMDLRNSDIYSAIGGGIRTRNENLVFGTVELRGYYFPRRNGNMNDWKIELNSNLRFKYTSTFINRPDFIVDN